MSTEDWRTAEDAATFFGHQQKRIQTEQRRPVVRKGADLVGPGIGVSAVRVTDWNDLLATFNGYYSSLAGANAAPTADEAFIGTVVSDSELGGTQTLTGLESQIEYSRTFNRNPSDPETLGFSDWRPATAVTSILRLEGFFYNSESDVWTQPDMTVSRNRGTGLTQTNRAIIRVERAGWYQIGAHCVFSAYSSSLAMQVAKGSDGGIDGANPLIVTGALDGISSPVPSLNGSTVAYLEAGDDVRMFTFSNDGSGTIVNSASLYVMEV